MCLFAHLFQQPNPISSNSPIPYSVFAARTHPRQLALAENGCDPCRGISSNPMAAALTRGVAFLSLHASTDAQESDALSRLKHPDPFVANSSAVSKPFALSGRFTIHLVSAAAAQSLAPGFLGSATVWGRFRCPEASRFPAIIQVLFLRF